MAEKRIVYLESEESAISSLGEVLKELNYGVEIAKNTAVAEKVASEFEPDLFIVSMDITTSDPTDLIKKIRKNKSLSKIPFVFISQTFDEDTFFDEFSELKKDRSYFMKRPFQTEDLVDIIESSIGLPTPPKGVFPVSLETQREIINLRKKNEELKTELSQKDREGDSSKEKVAEKAAYIKELQSQLDALKAERGSIEEELKLVKDDLYKKNKSLEDKERKFEELKIKNSSESDKLKREIDDIKKELEEDRQKHKKAQQALRDFYKPKIASASKFEKELKDKDGKIEALEKELEKEKAFRDKMKKMMADT